MGKAPGIRLPPSRGSIFQRHGRRKPKLALVAEHHELIKVGARLWDGDDEYKVSDTGTFHVEPWAQVYNIQFPENRRWFRVADLDALAVIL